MAQTKTSSKFCCTPSGCIVIQIGILALRDYSFTITVYCYMFYYINGRADVSFLLTKHPNNIWFCPPPLFRKSWLNHTERMSMQFLWRNSCEFFFINRPHKVFISSRAIIYIKLGFSITAQIIRIELCHLFKAFKCIILPKDYHWIGLA